MKRSCILLLSMFSFLPVLRGQVETMDEVIERGLETAEKQALFLSARVENQAGRLPKTYEDGMIKTADYHSWIAGFFPGILWLLYENHPTDELKRWAELYTMRVEPAKGLTSTHDVGFMLYCSFGNGYRLTGNPAYLATMKTGAASLATRYNDKIGAIRSWESNGQWQYPVIIDNLMNLELLSFMSRAADESRWMYIADRHAQTTLANHFREDNSCYHVVSYDTITGLPHAKQTHQGFSDSSAWSRGQAWALYGYTMMYRETGRAEYLQQARKIETFIEHHPRLPDDKVPYWDFDAPDIPDALRDVSAAAIMASALVELGCQSENEDADKCLALAEALLRSLTSPDYLAEPGTNGGFILRHGVGNHNKQSEMDVPLSYADYYYVEALLRFKKMRYEK